MNKEHIIGRLEDLDLKLTECLNASNEIMDDVKELKEIEE